MSEESFIEKQEQNISIHIFSVSAAMIGVCFTVIGIIGVMTNYSKVNTVGDDITALDAFLFLAACIVSYVAMRTQTRKIRYTLEKIADGFFLGALTLMAGVGAFLVFILNCQR